MSSPIQGELKLPKADHPGSRHQVFRALVERHQKMLWLFARSLGAEAALADDLVQESFLAAFKAGLEVRSPGESASYLRLTLARRLQRERQKRGVVSIDPELAEQTWTLWTREDVAQPPAQRALEQCLQELDKREAYAISLRYRDQRPTADVGRVLGLKPEGAHSLLRRTRKKLKDCITAKLRRHTDDE